MAYARRVLVENVARGLEEGTSGRTAFQSLAIGWLRATSIVKGLAYAIMGLLVAKLLKRGGVELRSRNQTVAAELD